MEEITIDLKDLFQVVMANKKKIAAITAAFMIAGGAYLLVAPPVYQSTSLLRIKQDKGLGDSILSKVSGGNAMDDKQRMMTDAEILKSRNVVLRLSPSRRRPAILSSRAYWPINSRTKRPSP